MEHTPRPSFELAQKILPAPLLTVILNIFNEVQPVLVGGTALAGFYFGHRRSDDIDLFCENDFEYKATLHALHFLKEKDLKIKSENKSAHYYHALCEYKKHSFTVDIVLDTNLFKIGQFVMSEKNIRIATLKTLFKMKCATLVSRCSEKDLFDLVELFEYYKNHSLSDVVSFGYEIDSGVNVENLLLSIGGANLKESACDFSLQGETAQQNYKKITQFQKSLLKELKIFAQTQTSSPLTEIVKALKKM